MSPSNRPGWTLVAAGLCAGASLSSLYSLQWREQWSSILPELWAPRSSLLDACPSHHFKAHLYSVSPLIIYLENFISGAEAEYIISSKSSLLEPAKTYSAHNETIDKSQRDASAAYLSTEDDALLSCIIDRARNFHDPRSYDSLEHILFQRYGVGGHFRSHYDAQPDEAVYETGGNRASTILLYLEANCTGGGTRFFELEPRTDQQWCQFIDCNDDGEGTTFKPLAGNAVFWSNLRDSRRRHQGTRHSGLPVLEGSKAILNLWFWKDLM